MAEKNGKHPETKKKLSFNIEENIKHVQETLGNSSDLTKREFELNFQRKIRMVSFLVEGLSDKAEAERVIRHLIEYTDLSGVTLQGTSLAETLISKFLPNASLQVSNQWNELIDAVLSGDSVFFFDRCEQAIIARIRNWETRSVEEPQTEQVIRGPRDGFTESVRTNTALVRRRIRDPYLRVEALIIGEKSKTDINIMYLKDTAKEELVDEVKNRLGRIKINAILESGYIEELIEDAPYSPFSTVMSTERPDKVASAILEGKVAIFVDNTPFVLIVPTYFWQFLQAGDDYYSRFMTGSFNRMVRYVAFVISLTLPSIFVMLVSFHQEMIPTPLALTIASGRDVIPFPVLLEALIMELAFELMREAGLRMPKPIGQAVSIVGSLVIGQAAVQAGLVSPFMVIIVAITGISSFAIPNYAASVSIRLIRFFILIASGTMGLLGFATTFSLFAIHAMSLRSFGESYLAPATPFKPSDQKDFVIRFPIWGMVSEPELAEGVEDAIGDEQMPRPNNKEYAKESSSEGKDESKSVENVQRHGEEKTKADDNVQTYGDGKVKIRSKSHKSRRSKDEK